MTADPTQAPRLEVIGSTTQLLVDGSPAILLGGQLHNSSTSDPARITRGVERAALLNANVVLAPVSWALSEPVEGSFDFSLVDRMLSEARRLELRLVMLWFGAFKNAASTYAPSWVRSDRARFPRARVESRFRAAFSYPGATPKPVLSVFGPDLRAADAAAFTALIEHLARHDEQHTVVLVQVENEVGLLADSRDRSPVAEAAWHSPVPDRLLQALTAPPGHQGAPRPQSVVADLWQARGGRRSGTWPEVFGDDWAAEELFMAWSFADYVEELAARGQASKAIPMYVNAWLGPQPGQDQAGAYPSGGPSSRVLEVWKIAAPSIAILAPDIYVDDSASAMRTYQRADNPLFVPETRSRLGELFRALGQHSAIGWSVFGIEDGRQDNQVATAFARLRYLQGLITDAQRTGNIAGIVLEPGETEAVFDLGGVTVTARGTGQLFAQMLLDAGVQAPPATDTAPSQTEGPGVFPEAADTRACGILLALGEDSFLLVGQGLTVDFSHPTEDIEIDAVAEGSYGPDGWVPGRVLNGDERLMIIPIDSVGVVRIQLLRPSPAS